MTRAKAGRFHERVNAARDKAARECIAEALEAHDGNILKAAEAIGLNRSYMHQLMRKYGLKGWCKPHRATWAQQGL